MKERKYRDALGIRFGRVVARLRMAKNWSRPTLARRAGVSERYVRLIEHGYSVPTLSVVVELAAVLDVTPEELVRAATEQPPG